MGMKAWGGDSEEPVAGLERERGLGRKKRDDRWQRSPVAGGPVWPRGDARGTNPLVTSTWPSSPAVPVCEAWGMQVAVKGGWQDGFAPPRIRNLLPGEGLPQHPSGTSTCGEKEPKAPEGTWKHKASPELGRDGSPSTDLHTWKSDFGAERRGSSPLLPACPPPPKPCLGNCPGLPPGSQFIPEPLQGSKMVCDKQVMGLSFASSLQWGLNNPQTMKDQPKSTQPPQPLHLLHGRTETPRTPLQKLTPSHAEQERHHLPLPLNRGCYRG